MLEPADADQGCSGKVVMEVLVELVRPGGEEVELKPQRVKIGSIVIIRKWQEGCKTAELDAHNPENILIRIPAEMMVIYSIGV